MFDSDRWRRLDRRLDRLEVFLRILLKKGNYMAKEIDDLIAAVAAEKSVTQSAIVLLQELHAKLDEAIAAGDMSAVAQAVADLKSNSDALAAAVVANTPVAPVEPAPAPGV